MKNRRNLSPSSLLATLTLAASLAWAPPAPASGGRPVTVMTWNLYFGFDEKPLFEAAATGEPERIAAAVSDAWTQIRATDFTARAAAIAKQVKSAGPDLLAVQEAVQYVRVDGTTGDSMEMLDHIQILVDALKAEGLSYEAANILEDTQAVLPDAEGNYVQLLDRTAILARVESSPLLGRVTLSNPMRGTFTNLAALCIVPGPGDTCELPLLIKRGWLSVDVRAGGALFRFVTAHLEDAGETPDPALEQLQLAQAAELVSSETGPFATILPVVLVGDFNTDGFKGWATYRYLTGPSPSGASLQDAWPALHPKDPGLTWGPNADLLAAFPAFTQRLDFVFLRRDSFDLRSARVIGATRESLASTGIWPSDHAGLVVSLQVESPESNPGRSPDRNDWVP